jgi:hypothetical protein
MIRGLGGSAVAVCLLMAAQALFTTCYAQEQVKQEGKADQVTQVGQQKATTKHGQSEQQIQVGDGQAESGEVTETKLGISLLKNIALDEKAIWTSPGHLRLADTDWIIPFAGITAISLYSDTHVSRALTGSPSRVSKSTTFSNYGIGALGGITGGMYILGKITHSDHQQEAALLSGEAAVDAVGATTVLQYAFGRQRPADGTGQGPFWHGGTSFPSDHSTAAWAVASVMAHEYPSTWSKLFFYGLASAVSLSRVTGKDHFPTDVIVGGAIGWFTGQHVFRAHHDPDLGGSSWETFVEAREENGGRNIRNAGSPYVPLDSWIYPNLDRLIAYGYIPSAFQDVWPLTRVEIANLVQEAGENIAAAEPVRGDADKIYATLQYEFQNEAPILNGEGKEHSIRLESLYTNVTDISGQPLNDSYHFGQTIIDNFGRPYQEGFNTYDGFSGYATTGRYAIYVRGEYQAAPSGPAFPLAAREVISTTDTTPLQPAMPVPSTNQFALLDAYVSANVGGWSLSAGKQSLWWGRGVGGSLMLSDNAEPMYMFRARPIESFELPWIFRWFGPMKTDFFIGQLAGNEFPPRPLIHGIKITAKRTRNLEASFIYTTEFGGVGRPVTAASILNSFFSVSSSDTYLPNHNPGKRTIGADFSYTFPHVRDWLQFYANGLLPEDNPTNVDNSKSPIYIWERLAIRSGIYMPRLPHLPKLDLRIESVYTDPPTDRSRFGEYIYYNDFYHELYVNKNNLIGDWVGRQGMGFQGWSTYWFSPKDSIQFAYRHAKVDSDFIPRGETINDGSIKVNWQVRPEWSLSASVQYEKWLAPILASTAQTNWTSSVQIQFTPHSWGW